MLISEFYVYFRTQDASEWTKNKVKKNNEGKKWGAPTKGSVFFLVKVGALLTNSLLDFFSGFRKKKETARFFHREILSSPKPKVRKKFAT